VTANPGWDGTTCDWTSGCLPATFPVKVVNVVWESSAEEGETALEHGQADIATIPSTDVSSILMPLIRAGDAQVTSALSFTVFFTNFNLNFNQEGAQDLLPSGAKLNAPSNLFQDLAFRQFLIHAYPYETVQDQYNAVDGITTGTMYGGAIPEGMGNYYPSNVSWDLANPSASGTNTAGWWWNQVEVENGAAAAACLSTRPCVFPFLSFLDDPIQDEENAAWSSEISTYSDGAIDMVNVDCGFDNCGCLLLPCYVPPMSERGWDPDYPDPTDYVNPLYMPDSTYTYGDALSESLGLYMNDCPGSYVWAVAAVTTSCQGTAYDTMVSLLTKASTDMNLDQRALLYNEAEHIAQQLGIFVPNSGQSLSDWVSESWLDETSLNVNPMIGGAGDSTWYAVQYGGQKPWISTGPSIISFGANPFTVVAGSWTNITVNASGGTGFLTYSYTGLPSGCSSANETTIMCRPTSAGTYFVTVRVVDQKGFSNTETLTLTVTSKVSSETSVSPSMSPYIIALIGVMIVALALDAIVFFIEWEHRKEAEAVSSAKDDNDEEGLSPPSPPRLIPDEDIPSAEEKGAGTPKSRK